MFLKFLWDICTRQPTGTIRGRREEGRRDLLSLPQIVGRQPQLLVRARGRVSAVDQSSPLLRLQT